MRLRTVGPAAAGWRRVAAATTRTGGAALVVTGVARGRAPGGAAVHARGVARAVGGRGGAVRAGAPPRDVRGSAERGVPVRRLAAGRRGLSSETARAVSEGMVPATRSASRSSVTGGIRRRPAPTRRTPRSWAVRRPSTLGSSPPGSPPSGRRPESSRSPQRRSPRDAPERDRVSVTAAVVQDVVVGAVVSAASATGHGRGILGVGVASEHRGHGLASAMLRAHVGSFRPGDEPLSATVTVAERDWIDPLEPSLRVAVARRLFEAPGSPFARLPAFERSTRSRSRRRSADQPVLARRTTTRNVTATRARSPVRPRPGWTRRPVVVRLARHHPRAEQRLGFAEVAQPVRRVRARLDGARVGAQPPSVFHERSDDQSLPAWTR